MKPGIMPVPLDVYQGNKFVIPRIEVPDFASEDGPSSMDDIADFRASLIRNNVPYNMQVSVIETTSSTPGVIGAVKATILTAKTLTITAGEGLWDISAIDGDGEEYTWLRGPVTVWKRVREEEG